MRAPRRYGASAALLLAIAAAGPGQAVTPAVPGFAPAPAVLVVPAPRLVQAPADPAGAEAAGAPISWRVGVGAAMRPGAEAGPLLTTVVEPEEPGVLR